MENILNPELYKKAKKQADKVYERHSAYKSMYIQKLYKNLGGKYKNKKNKQGVSRWNKEKWIQCEDYIKYGKKIPCGANNKKFKVCRPLIRVNKYTPTTLPELLKIHKKKDLLKLIKMKQKDMDGRLYLKLLKFYPSK